MDVELEYYNRKYGDDRKTAFVHLVYELGELARALEQDQPEIATHEITEIAAITRFLAHTYDFKLEEGVENLYTRKLAKLKASG